MCQVLHRQWPIFAMEQCGSDGSPTGTGHATTTAVDTAIAIAKAIAIAIAIALQYSHPQPPPWRLSIQSAAFMAESCREPEAICQGRSLQDRNSFRLGGLGVRGWGGLGTADIGPGETPGLGDPWI